MAKDKSELTRVYSFRTTEEGGAAWDKKIARSGYTKSEFFRKAVQDNQTEIVEKPVATRDAKRAVFLLAKASNNLNQIAHRINAEHRAGKLSESTFARILDRLDQLNQLLLSQAKEATK